MDLGDVLAALGLDLQVLQGAASHMYLEDEGLQVVEGPGGLYRLTLAVPLVETREPCGPLPFRLGLHLQGDLQITGETNPRVFDTWVRLRPEAVRPDGGLPVGRLSFDAVESVAPEFAKAAVEAEFGPEGSVGQALAGMELPLFADLLESVTRALDPTLDPDLPVDVDVSLFSFDLRLGQPAELPRPVYDVRGSDDDAEVIFEGETTSMTVPALVATVALAGQDPTMPSGASVVRAGSGLQLITSKTLFDLRLKGQGDAMVDTDVEGLTIDKMELEAVDGGITVDGAGHKTGADVTFEGTVIARYLGGTDGHLVMKPAVDTDVDQAWWVTGLSFLAAIVPGLGWILGDVFIWGPTAAAPGKIDAALRAEFGDALKGVADQLAAGFGIEGEEGEDPIPSAAFLDDIWIFDGNLAVSVVALLGYNPATVEGVLYDTAFIKLRRSRQRRKPVQSVEQVRLSTGQWVRPWQAAQLLDAGIVDIPDHHVVRNPKAREGIFLRSDPNETDADNLVT